MLPTAPESTLTADFLELARGEHHRIPHRAGVTGVQQQQLARRRDARDHLPQLHIAHRVAPDRLDGDRADVGGDEEVLAVGEVGAVDGAVAGDVEHEHIGRIDAAVVREGALERARVVAFCVVSCSTFTLSNSGAAFFCSSCAMAVASATE